MTFYDSLKENCQILLNLAQKVHTKLKENPICSSHSKTDSKTVFLKWFSGPKSVILPPPPIATGFKMTRKGVTTIISLIGVILTFIFVHQPYKMFLPPSQSIYIFCSGPKYIYSNQLSPLIVFLLR